MATILTDEEVAKALYVEEDFDAAELQRLAALASEYIKRKTGYDFAEEEAKNPLAVECAMQYVRQVYFGAKGYNKEHDYRLGISSLLVDLQVIANDKVSEA